MGHGHIIPNPDGSKARCGGPGLCATCAMEAASVGQKRVEEMQQEILRIDAERARAEYTEALAWIRELTGLPELDINQRVAQRLAEKGTPSCPTPSPHGT